MKKLSIVAAGALFAWSGNSMAQPQGLALSLERGFGLLIESQTTESDLATQTETETSFGLGVSGGESVYGTARLGLDYVLDSNLSLGAGVGFTTISDETEFEPAGGGASTTTENSGSALIFAPRVGYLAMLTEHLGLWPRGGITTSQRA